MARHDNDFPGYNPKSGANALGSNADAVRFVAEANEAIKTKRYAPPGFENNVIAIRIDEERQGRALHPGGAAAFAHPMVPAFMAHIPKYNHPAVWFQAVLPWVATLKFVISSNVDLNYFNGMLNASNLPNLRDNITNVEFDQFHWFSGIRYNRVANPYFSFLRVLPNLKEVTLAFHQASFTTSKWNEKERTEMEVRGDLLTSKELRVMKSYDIYTKYGMQELLYCKNVNTIWLECRKSPMVDFFARPADSLAPLYEIRDMLMNRFLMDVGRDVDVLALCTGGEDDSEDEHRTYPRANHMN